MKLTSSSLKKEMTANKVFGGAPQNTKAGKNPAWVSAGSKKSMTMRNMSMGKTAQTTSKMTPQQIAKRKKSRISNAAGKLMGGLYSK